MSLKAWSSITLFAILIYFIIATMGDDIDDMEAQDNIDYCTGIKCGGKPHTMCTQPGDLAPSCSHFEEIPLTRVKIRNILNGHNGLRNRVATDRYHPASDMQYIYWDKNLQTMASKYLQQCSIKKDSCDFIYNSTYTVGQNYRFRRGEPLKNWEQVMIHEWFMEGKDFVHRGGNQLLASQVNNYTQFIWAKTNKIGCAAARMMLGYFMVCNYYPKEVVGDPIFELGEPCTNCPDAHASCSRVFQGLCGVDDTIYADGNTFRPTKLTVLLLAVLVLHCSRWKNALNFLWTEEAS